MKKLFIAFMLISTSSLFASDLNGKFGLGANLGYPVPSFGNSFNNVANPKIAYGIHGRYHFTSSFGLELGVTRAEFKRTNYKFNNGNILGFYRTAASNDFTFVVGAGLAITKISNYTPSNLKLSSLVRLGVEQNITADLTFGAYADYQYVSKLLGAMPTKRAHVISPVLAITYYFGSDAVKSQINSNEDLKKMMNETKEKAESKLNEKKDELKLKAGMDKDTDGDGVLDSEDKCPNSKAGDKVNTFGCAETEKAEINLNINFDSGKAIVKPEYSSKLNEVKEFMEKFKNTKLNIEGYTDNSGSAVANTKLSQARASAVMKELIKLGVDKSRLTAKGYGPKNPIADNNTTEGKQTNRRVVAVIKTTK